METMVETQPLVRLLPHLAEAVVVVGQLLAHIMVTMEETAAVVHLMIHLAVA